MFQAPCELYLPLEWLIIQQQGCNKRCGHGALREIDLWVRRSWGDINAARGTSISHNMSHSVLYRHMMCFVLKVLSVSFWLRCTRDDTHSLVQLESVLYCVYTLCQQILSPLSEAQSRSESGWKRPDMHDLYSPHHDNVYSTYYVLCKYCHVPCYPISTEGYIQCYSRESPDGGYLVWLAGGYTMVFDPSLQSGWG